MRLLTRHSIWLLLLFVPQFAIPQPNRVLYNNQQLFLSGANLAWVSFANDIGPGYTDFDTFADVMLQLHDHGGNVLRWWLHTNGTASPEFNDTGLVIGPGTGTIEDLRKVLDLAWEREIGLDLCLWSFDMLRSSNSATVLSRNTLLLTDTTYAQAYINNCLIPMVDSLKGHPAIVAWEIFNEPEGMSNEFGWSDIQHVPMSAIQRFVNLCAGAIHRADTAALVTNGAWSFRALTDIPLPSTVAKTGSELALLSPEEKQELGTRFNQKYRMSLTVDEVIQHLQRVSSLPTMNYYSDSRLIAAGGDPDGTLDFYSVHYYDWGGTDLSPFHHAAGYWMLDKPIVVAEFAMKDTYSTPKAYLYSELYVQGYAGALAWSWTDVAFSSHEDVLAALQFMWDHYKAAVDVNGIAGEWPTVAITSPADKAELPDTTAVTIKARAHDSDGSVVLVEFFADDTLKLDSFATLPPDTVTYTTTWTSVPSGFHTLTAEATDNQGHVRTSERVRITVGPLSIARLEAEQATRQGSDMTVLSDPNASNGAYLKMATQSGTVSWQLPAVPAAGDYEIAFGYRLSFATPKSQYVNVNGVRFTEMVFDGSMYAWLEKKLSVSFLQGSNVLQMELSWGWMDLDYLAVPISFVSSVGEPDQQPVTFSLQQNYPNPFNPGTTIGYSLPKTAHVKLAVFDILGRQVAVLVDERRAAGTHEVPFDAGRLTSGVYIYRIVAGDYTQTKRMVLLK